MHSERLNNKLFVWVSDYLDVPAHSYMLFNASVFPHVFTLYIVQVWSVVLYLSMFSVFNLPNKTESRNKYLTMDKQKEEKNPQEIESEDELPRVRLGGQEGLKFSWSTLMQCQYL